jgi:hypothetical protein
VKPDHVQPGAECYRGDCLAVLPHLPPGSVDAVICDPPYPCIDRSYGRLTEAEWFGLMRAVVPEVRRVLKPSGSAVFVLQPNSERAGRMRLWLWEFMCWVGREWGIVQDAYWWNHAALASGGASERGLLRGSLKTCVWCGPPDCHRDQSAVLWSESDETKRRRLAARCGQQRSPSGSRSDRKRAYDSCAGKGGSSPFNVIPLPGVSEEESRGGGGHPAPTPLALCSWWVRYVSPVGGVVLDPFQGSGTVGLAALSLGRHYVGIERDTDYHAIAVRRLAEAAGPLFANPAGTVDIDSPPSAPEPTLFPL